MRSARAIALALITAASISPEAQAQDGLSVGLPVTAPIPPASVKDPISPAIKGLVAQIEDDAGEDDVRLVRAITKGCETQLIGKKHRWRIDWRTAETPMPGDSFIYISGPELKLSIVAAVWKPKQSQKLAELLAATRSMWARCQPAQP